MSFESLELDPKLLSAIAATGFTTPTSVQIAAIPPALAGHDLMVSAQTGSGKTAAFMLPALNRIAKTAVANKGVGVQVLVLTPTRELAQQVADATAVYGKHLSDLRIAVVVGGMPYGAQLKALSRRVDVLIATPGRLIDHLKSGRVNLSTVHTLVLDEADRMLDMGFIEDIESIVSNLPKERQTLLFSATLDGTIARLAAKMMRDPQRLELATQKEKHTNITQSLMYADDLSHKMQLLDHVLRDVDLGQAIVFTSTKRGADELADRLADQGFSAAALHGDMNQRQRTRTLSMLQRGQLRVLVATDVAARGIDVQGISHAINFDLPMQAEDYVHRIGRTGRAGRSGQAFTLATHAERHKIRRIESYIGRTIDSHVIEGLEPKRAARPTPGDRSGKPSFGKRPTARGGYAGRNDSSAPRTSAPREARPSFGARDDRPARPEGGFRADREPRAEGGFRSETPRPTFGHRPERDSRPAYAPRGEADRRPSAGFSADRPVHAARPDGDRPARPAGGFGARTDKPFEKRTGAAPVKRFAKTSADFRRD